MSKLSKYFVLASCFSCASIFAHNAGTTSLTFDQAIQSANAGVGNDFTVTFTADVTLVNPVRALNASGSFIYIGENMTLNAFNHSLKGPMGEMGVRGVVVGGQGSSGQGTTAIKNLKFNSLNAIGGNGENKGGGGMGAGGGLYVGSKTRVVLQNCSFTNCHAKGGNGGTNTLPPGGGGGCRGNGGSGPLSAGGGGGFGGNGSSQMNTGGGGGGCDGFSQGNANGTTPGFDFDGSGTPSGPGVGGMGVAMGTDPPGGFGGGGGANLTGTKGGLGGFCGGGAANINIGGDGGFGGGGAGSGSLVPTVGKGGKGGFGGGGGASNSPTPVPGGFGGGNGQTIGGRGAGFGGAIFIEPGATVTIKDSITFKNNSAKSGSFGNKNTDATAGFGALGDDIFMMSQSQLIFDIKSHVTIPTPIHSNQGILTPKSSVSTGRGGLLKKGPATIKLTGNNTYTGTTTIDDGEFIIENNGSVVTDVNVNEKGNLTGSMSINKDITGHGGNLTNKGIVSPGGNKKIGTISIEKNYKQTHHGLLIMDIKPSGNDKVIVKPGSKVTLDGTLQIVVEKGKYKPGTKYTLINGNSKGTKFSKVTQTGPAADSVKLKVTYNPVVVTILKPQNIQSGIPSEVHKVLLQSATPGSDLETVIEALGTLNDKQVNKALISLSPVNYGNIEWINARNNSLVADILSQHLFELCCSPRECCNCNCCSCICNASFWIEGFGNFMSNSKRFNNLDRYNANAGGVLTGIDWCFGPFYAGGSFGYTYTELHWKDRGRGHSNSFYGALYGSWEYCDWFVVDASVIGGGTDYRLKRKMEFASIDRTAKGHFWGEFFTAHLGFETEWDWCCTVFEPFALVDYHYFNRNHFKEHGAESLDLNVHQKTQNFLRAEAGVRAYLSWMCDCFCASPYLGLSWVGEFPLNHSKQKANFVGHSPVMDVESYHSSVQLASPEAGVKWTYTDGYSCFIGYKGLFNGHTCINQIEGRLEWVF